MTSRRDEVLLALRAAYREAGFPVSTRAVLAKVVSSGTTPPSIESVGRHLRSLKQRGLVEGQPVVANGPPFWTPIAGGVA